MPTTKPKKIIKATVAKKSITKKAAKPAAKSVKTVAKTKLQKISPKAKSQWESRL